MYLTGPGGVGESSILFMTAAAVLRHNAQLLSCCGLQQTAASSDPSSPILLLYISNAGELVRLSCEEAAVELCKMVNSLNLRQHWKLSVLQSYQTAFGITNSSNRNIAKGKLPQNVKYIYATTNAALLGPSSQSSGHSVFLMRKENITNLNEQLRLEKVVVRIKGVRMSLATDLEWHYFSVRLMKLVKADLDIVEDYGENF
ncbi:hypothetical protein EON65_38985 [archaeon]|nr:MAG: hypothetical protein EON65_38985 [archaeon]